MFLACDGSLEKVLSIASGLAVQSSAWGREVTDAWLR